MESQRGKREHDGIFSETLDRVNRREERVLELLKRSLQEIEYFTQQLERAEKREITDEKLFEDLRDLRQQADKTINELKTLGGIKTPNSSDVEE